MLSGTVANTTCFSNMARSSYGATTDDCVISRLLASFTISQGDLPPLPAEFLSSVLVAALKVNGVSDSVLTCYS